MSNVIQMTPTLFSASMGGLTGLAELIGASTAATVAIGVTGGIALADGLSIVSGYKESEDTFIGSATQKITTSICDNLTRSQVMPEIQRQLDGIQQRIIDLVGSLVGSPVGPLADSAGSNQLNNNDPKKFKKLGKLLGILKNLIEQAEQLGGKIYFNPLFIKILIFVVQNQSKLDLADDIIYFFQGLIINYQQKKNSLILKSDRSMTKT